MTRSLFQIVCQQRLQISFGLQLDISVVDDYEISLLYKYFDDNFVSILPHASNQSLSRENGLGESEFHRLELILVRIDLRENRT